MKRKPNGFTLVELLVTISIIIVLAALSFVGFTRAREGARAASCVNNLKQIASSQAAITEDTGGFFIHAGRSYVGGKRRNYAYHFTVLANESLTYTDPWSKLNARITDVDYLSCPTARSHAAATMAEANGAARWRTYALNNRMGVAQEQNSENGNATDGASRLEHLQSPHLTICASERKANANGRYPSAIGQGSSQPKDGSGVADFHNGGCHVAYMDGHVARITQDTFPYTDNTMPDGRKVRVRTTPKTPDDVHWALVWRGMAVKREIPEAATE